MQPAAYTKLMQSKALELILSFMALAALMLVAALCPF